MVLRQLLLDAIEIGLCPLLLLLEPPGDHLSLHRGQGHGREVRDDGGQDEVGFLPERQTRCGGKSAFGELGSVQGDQDRLHCGWLLLGFVAPARMCFMRSRRGWVPIGCGLRDSLSRSFPCTRRAMPVPCLRGRDEETPPGPRARIVWGPRGDEAADLPAVSDLPWTAILEGFGGTGLPIVGQNAAFRDGGRPSSSPRPGGGGTWRWRVD